jgi:hypothetical protein
LTDFGREDNCIQETVISIKVGWSQGGDGMKWGYRVPEVTFCGRKSFWKQTGLELQEHLTSSADHLGSSSHVGER